MYLKNNYYLNKLVNYFFIIFLPICISIIAASYAGYYLQHVVKHKMNIKIQEYNTVKTQKEIAYFIIQSVISDIKIISSNYELKLLIDKNYDKNQLTLPRNFLSISKYKGTYDQIRVLDTTGMERLRIDLKEENPVFIEESRLQFKGDRYYFQDTFELNEEEIYFSPFDLNIEHGSLEIPYKPMIRVGTPIFGSQHEKKGIILLNYLGDRLIEKMVSLKSPKSRFFILNAESYYLYSEDKEKTWGFMFEEKKGVNFSNDFNNEWNIMKKEDCGQYFNDKGLFTFEKIYPLKSVSDKIKSSTGSADAYDKSTGYIPAEDFHWILLSFIPDKDIHATEENLELFIIAADILLIIFSGIMAFALARQKVKRKIAEEDLLNLNNELEARIKDRTKKLSEANKKIKAEIAKYKLLVKEKLELEKHVTRMQKLEAIGTMANGIAHDFNNILTPIVGYAQVMTESSDYSKFPHYSQKILTASNRAKELVKQILTFSRAEDEKYKLIRINDVAKDALDMVSTSIPSTIEFKIDLSEDCGTIYADPLQIHQIIINLCTNAYHAMRSMEYGVITVDLKVIYISRGNIINKVELKTGNYVCLAISDTGTGIADEDKDKIFDPYFTTKGNEGGTGLGLAIVNRIIKNMEGEIYVYSQKGEGTTFKLYIPQKSGNITANKNINLTGKKHQFSDLRILLVDDEKEILAIEELVLKNMGFRITKFNLPEEALGYFTGNYNEIDLVITDSSMPKINGLKLSEELLKIKKDIPVILTTGFINNKNELRAYNIGIKKIIVKPLLRGELIKAISECINPEKE